MEWPVISSKSQELCFPNLTNHQNLQPNPEKFWFIRIGAGPRNEFFNISHSGSDGWVDMRTTGLAWGHREVEPKYCPCWTADRHFHSIAWSERPGSRRCRFFSTTNYHGQKVSHVGVLYTESNSVLHSFQQNAFCPS